MIELHCFCGFITVVIQCPGTMQHRYENNLRHFTIVCGVMPCPVVVALSSCPNLFLSKPVICIRGEYPAYCATFMKQALSAMPHTFGNCPSAYQ